MRTHLGLYIIQNGEHLETDTLEEFTRKVEAAAAAKPKITGRGAPQNLMKRTDGEHFWPIREDRRCAFTHSSGDKAGKRCGSWAMRGATRCVRHGGYRENPAHPKTIKRLGIIQHQREKSLAKKALRRAPHKIRLTVENTLQAEGLPLYPQSVLNGIDALQQDDNGKAWRRFIKAAKASAPTGQQRAKKKRLKQD